MWGVKNKNHGKVWLHEGYTHMEKNAKGNRETLPNPFLILKPVAVIAEACHKLQASFGKHGHYVKICAGFLT